VPWEDLRESILEEFASLARTERIGELKTRFRITGGDRDAARRAEQRRQDPAGERAKEAARRARRRRLRALFPDLNVEFSSRRRVSRRRYLAKMKAERPSAWRVYLDKAAARARKRRRNNPAWREKHRAAARRRYWAKAKADAQRIARMEERRRTRQRKAAAAARRRRRTEREKVRKKELLMKDDLTLATATRKHIDLVMALCSNNLSSAATVLGVNRRTLQRRDQNTRYNARQEATKMPKKKTVAGKTTTKPKAPTKKAPYGLKKDGTPKKKPGGPAAK
jgi:hypothetical protein